MPQTLSERPEELLRQFFVANLRPNEIEGYNPKQTDQTATDFLPITDDWSDYGDYYPVVAVQETDGPTVPNSGVTNYNGQQGDGSGPNQTTTYNITVSCQAVQNGPYRNSVDYDTLTKTLYDECHTQVQTNSPSAIDEALTIGMTPPTQTRSEQELDSGSTETWVQRQGTVAVTVINTP